ncbi:MAG: glycoside hydrolase family 2 [Alteromonadaceae bacterium]|nr:glycoside hydrolase family 2 [Alteromonadaceae bacterium]
MKRCSALFFILPAVCILIACTQVADFNADLPKNVEVRDQQILNNDWQFIFTDEIPAGIHAPSFKWTGAENVSVPHSWNRVGFYLDDQSAHIHNAGNINNTQGKGLYRKVFNVPAQTENKRLWLEFDAVSRVANVWVNGKFAGEHRGSFNRFRFDITDLINVGRPNVLVVQADNSKPTADSTTADTLPIAGDFFVHGGIYRPVRLVTTSNIHVDMKDFGGPGVYATTAVEGDKAVVSIESRITSNGGEAENVTLLTQLTDDTGKVVAKDVRDILLLPDETEITDVSLSVSSPQLWQGIDNPYLYTLAVSILDNNDNLLDTVKQNIGLRTIEISADKGLTLNGQPLALRGVGYHQDREGKGWAVSAEEIEEDVQLLMDMGVNTIRLAHYPHGQTVHDLADKLGLLLWDEIPLVSAWRYGEEHEAVNTALADNASLQLTEMVKQNFNHPSVAVWGIANEVDFGAVVPMFVQSSPGSNPDPLPILNRLKAEVAQLDPTRNSTLANCCAGVPTWDQSKVPNTSAITTTTGANRYFGWYYGAPSGLAENLDALHQQYPEQPLAVTEYGAGGAPSFHSDNPLGGPVAATGRNQPEEYMNYVHEENWRVLSARDYLWANWIWNGFDFATTTRREGDSQDINTKGLITYDRAIKKDAYYFYQANWSANPMVHVASRRYIQRAYQTTDIKVYSNGKLIELLVNDRKVSEAPDCDQNTCVWQNVRLVAGQNKIVARASGFASAPSDRVEDSVMWHLDESQINAYYIDAGAIMSADSSKAHFGSDDFFTGGKAMSLDKPGGWGRPSVKAVIGNTQEQALHTTYRAGEFAYHLPLDNGQYKVTLSLVAPDSKSRFDVFAEGSALFVNISGKQNADGSFTAFTVAENVNVLDGSLELSFKPSVGEAYVSAISVIPVK